MRMKTYKKRIAFCISDQHLVVHGGIGQFAKGFVEMAGRMDWKVDLILDKAPTNSMADVIEKLGANILFPNSSVSYSDHTGTFAFSDSINFEKIINFRNSIMQAFHNNIYDMVICNSKEDMPAVLSLDLNPYIPVVFYTHEESMVFRDNRHFKGVFLESCNEFFNELMTLESINVGTQSERNKKELDYHDGKNVFVLPMPMTERELLKENYGEREGVLFIGRWEERKNPEAFLKVIKETGLPAKIITNSNGERKFKARLEELGITNYEIRAGIVGKEKADFIKSAKVYFNPSVRESYCFTFFECIGHMPCVVLDKADWTENFDHKYYEKAPLSEIPNIIKKTYKAIDAKIWYEYGALQYIKAMDLRISTYWKNFLDGFSPTVKSKSDSAKINQHETVKYSKYITDLKRTHLAIDDIKSVLTNKHKYNIIYTDKETYLTKDKSFVPKEETDNLESLFV